MPDARRHGDGHPDRGRDGLVIEHERGLALEHEEDLGHRPMVVARQVEPGLEDGVS